VHRQRRADAQADGQRWWDERGTPERAAATERRDRVAFLGKLFGEEG
jgi:hypothetical protein